MRLGDRAVRAAQEAAPGAVSGGAAAVQEQLRRQRGLLTADRLLAWLEQWSISPDEFQEWSEDPVGSSSWAAVVCSGALDRSTSAVAAAAAAACELGAAPASASQFEPDGWTDRLAAQALSPEALAATIRSRRLAWTRVRATGVLAASRAVAEELRQWVLADGLALEIAAAQAGCRTFLVDGVLEELKPPPLCARLSGALPGELLGPVEAGSTWTVLQLDAREEPDPADPAVLARAREAVVAEAIERAVLRHVDA